MKTNLQNLKVLSELLVERRWSLVPSYTQLIAPPAPPAVDFTNFGAAAWDFYRWLEEDFGLPITAPHDLHQRNLFEATKPAKLLPSALYTFSDLENLYRHVSDDPVSMIRRYSNYERGSTGRSHKRIPATDLVELEAAMASLAERKAWPTMMARFGQPCGTCPQCNAGQASYCKHTTQSQGARFSMERFFDAMQGFRSPQEFVESDSYQTWSNGEHARGVANHGLLLLWLHDRGFVDLDYSMLRNDPWRSGALWRGVSPSTIYSFLERRLGHPGFFDELEKNLRVDATLYAYLTCLALIMVRHRVKNMQEFVRPLNESEMAWAVAEYRTLRPALGLGAYAPVALTSDIRWGHLLLDHLRFWSWGTGGLGQSLSGKHAVHVELALAEMKRDGKPLLPLRPGMANLMYVNPYKAYDAAKTAGLAPDSFPEVVQIPLRAWLRYQYLQERAPVAVRLHYGNIVNWFAWLRGRQFNLDRFGQWDEHTLRQAIERYFAHLFDVEELSQSTMNNKWKAIRGFLQVLDMLEGIPKPNGLGLIHNYEVAKATTQVQTPETSLVDRIFADGVCALDRDWNQKRMRLFLTLCYSLGVRPGEAASFHLDCIKTDADGYPSWWIPRLKRKPDRPFPIVPLFHMEKLLEFYKEWHDHLVTTWSTCPVCTHEWNSTGEPITADGTVPCPACRKQVVPNERKEYHRPPGGNPRYLKDQPDVAHSWRYLFAAPLTGRSSPLGHVSYSTSIRFLRLSIYLAAFQNPQGLMRMETYDPRCRAGERRLAIADSRECRFAAPVDGIMECPLCKSPLQGRRGELCRARVSEPPTCPGRAANGELFCPECHSPLAELIHMTPNMFRHNSVDRFREQVGDLTMSAFLHGHTPRVQVESYSHVRPKEIFKKLHEVSAVPGALAAAMAAPSESQGLDYQHFNELLGTVVRRFSDAKAGPHWGTFQVDGTTVVLPETVWNTVDEYYWLSRLVYGMELAIARLLPGYRPAQLPAFLNEADLESTVKAETVRMKAWAKTKEGVKMLERNVQMNRDTLSDLERVLRPWAERHGGMDALVLQHRGGS